GAGASTTTGFGGSAGFGGSVLRPRVATTRGSCRGGSTTGGGGSTAGGGGSATAGAVSTAGAAATVCDSGADGSASGAGAAAGFTVFTRRGGGSAGAVGFGGSRALPAAAGFLPFATRVSAEMLPPRSRMLRRFAGRSTHPP